MRVNADSRSRHDPRYKRLARRLSVSHADAYGRAIWVWFELYERAGAFMSAEDIDIAAEFDGFAAAMVACELAEETPDGIRVRGNERAAWVEKRRDTAIEGGRARAATATRKSGRFVSSTTKDQPETSRKPAKLPAVDQPRTSPPDLAPAPALAPDLKAGPRQAQPVVETPERQAIRQVADCWYLHYEGRTGQRPTWTPEDKGKVFGQFKGLVKAKGADEVCRRIGILFDAPPRFLAGSVPDVSTLAQHFDKLVAPAVMPTRQLTTRAGMEGISPDEMAAKAQRLMAEERARGER